MDNCAAPSRTFSEKVLRATDYIYRHNDKGHREEAALDRMGGAGKGQKCPCRVSAKYDSCELAYNAQSSCRDRAGSHYLAREKERVGGGG